MDLVANAVFSKQSRVASTTTKILENTRISLSRDENSSNLLFRTAFKVHSVGMDGSCTVMERSPYSQSPSPEWMRRRKESRANVT